MKRNSCKRLGGETGLTLLEVVAALSISIVAFASVHLTAGTAILGKLLTSTTVSKEQQGRQVVEWIADRVRQAGFRADPTSLAPYYRCRNGIVSQDSSYYPTTSSLWITADFDNDTSQKPETRGFQLGTVSGIPVVTETVMPCPGDNTVASSAQPITSSSSVKVLSLAFAYYDKNGTQLTPPFTGSTAPGIIQSIRFVTMTVQVQANAGAHGLTTQTWSTGIALRNR